MATVVKTQSRRQSVLVCSLLVVSLLLSAAVGGEECVQGILPAETVNLYGPSSKNTELPTTARSRLYVFPSMNFTCSGTITDIRMRMEFVPGLPADSNVQQEVFAYFLIFHDGLNSATRRITHILFNQTNSWQSIDNSGQRLTEIWQNKKTLSIHVTEGAFIGLAVPDNRSPTMFTKGINLLPTSERVESHVYQLAASFSEFEGRVLEAARTADSSQFTTLMIAHPLIDVSFRADIATPNPSTTSPTVSSGTIASESVGIATTEPVEATQSGMTLFIVVGVVIASVVLAMICMLAASIAMVTVCSRKKKRSKMSKENGKSEKRHCDDGDDVTKDLGLKITDSVVYYETVGVEPNHYDTPLPHPTPLGIENKAGMSSDSEEYIVMQPCPAYDKVEDSSSSDYSYVQVAGL